MTICVEAGCSGCGEELESGKTNKSGYALCNICYGKMNGIHVHVEDDDSIDNAPYCDDWMWK